MEKRHALRDRSALVITILLLFVTLLALGLRIYGLDAQSLWYDEGFSVHLASMDLVAITELTAADIQPPLYYYLLHGWMELFGAGEAALRGLSVLWGVFMVPLIYAVAWRLFRSRLAGILAALLVAVSPLHVWYAQEVRMYTLLTFLCLLSSYFLLLVIQAERLWKALVLWVAYALAGVTALYTHYFAFFILTFQAFYLLIVWWRRGFPMRLIVGGVISGMIIVLAYLPWLPHLVTRYGADVSYWPGRLKLDQVLLDIAVFFVGGESISESAGIFLALGYGLVFFLCLFALLFRASRLTPRGSHLTSRVSRTVPDPAPKLDAMVGSQYPICFLLLYLVIPPMLILALSYVSPKFNARYVMVAHPALLLILAGGLAVLWERRGIYLGNLVRGTLATLALLFLLCIAVYANYNAYVDPAFTRADFRGAIRYVRKHVASDETIILISGHIYPIFDYYAPGVERHLLPDSPTLDTTRTLDYAIADDLNDWLTGRGGVWVVRWQDEVVDPVGYLTAMLAEAGEQQSIERRFKDVDLQHFRLPSGVRFSAQPVIAHPANFNFGNRLRLLGYAQTGEQQVTLFWQALQPLDEDYRVSLVLRDTLGQSWGQWDGRPAAYLHPTDRWREGQIVFGRYDLSLIPGSPPGDYGLEVGVYTEADPIGLDVLDEAGAPQGKRTMLGSVRLSVPAVKPNQLEVPHAGRIEAGGGLALLGWDLGREQAQPGDRLLLTLIWLAESQPQSDYGVRLLVTDGTGQTWDGGIFPLTNIWHPTSIWLPGQAWRGQNTFRLPIQTQPGEARLSVQLVDASGTPLGSVLDLATIQVQPTARTFVRPQPQVSRPANFDNRIALVGADLDPDSVSRGSVLRVTLYWQALAEMDVPYTVFVHLLGPDGQVVTGHDGEPGNGTRPTTSWVPGEYIADIHDVPIPADLPSGEYVVEVGLYDAGAPNMPRLLILGDGGQIAADRVIFGPVQVH